MKRPVKRSRELDPSRDPWTPIVPTKSEAAAIKALFARNANEHQQAHIVSFLIRLTGIKDMEFRPDRDASSFASGKRFVGLQLVKMTELSSEFIKTLPEG